MRTTVEDIQDILKGQGWWGLEYTKLKMDLPLLMQPGMPSRKVISTGAKGTKRSEVVTGDIGYTPRQGFKWKRKSAITNNKLEKIRTEKVIQTRSATATKTQGKNISTMKTHVSWK
ncbi:hypothetical protein FXO38_32382 [Capsicum annuum]|nr:hypothetical protein FXO38_32382 [Capsicum annuum]